MAGRFGGNWGSKAGSGGGRGGLGEPRLFPAVLEGSAAGGIGFTGGEYCVPTSTVGLGAGEAEKGRLCIFGPTAGL